MTLNAADTALIFGATLRLTRLVTTDDAGELVRGPADKWATTPKRRTLVDGLGCPFCVGYWLGVGVVGSYRLSSAHPTARTAWRLVAATLALNEVVGHAAIRIGDA